MNDFRYFQLYSMLNSLFTLVTSHSVTNYLINLFNNIKTFSSCQLLDTLYFNISHFTLWVILCYVNYSKPSNSPSFLSSSYWITAICLIADSSISTFLIKNSLSSICSPFLYTSIISYHFLTFTRFTKFFSLVSLITTRFMSILFFILVKWRNMFLN